MRVLRLTMGSLTFFGGIESHITYLNTELKRQGVTVRTEVLPAACDDEAAAGNRSTLSRHLAALARREQIDLVHSHNVHLDRDLARAAVEGADAAGLPHLLTIHDIGDDFAAMPAITAALDTLRSTHVVVTSPYNARRFRHVTGRDPVALIPPGIDFALFKEQVAHEPRTVAYPARLTPEKGALEAIALLRPLAAAHGPIRLLLSDRTRRSYGRSSGFLNELDRALEEAPGVNGEFVTEPDAILAIYHRAALTLVMPRRPEGFGLVPLESLACGRPVVAVPTGGMEWLRDVPGAVCVSPDRPADVLSAIEEILADWPAWFELSRSARTILKRQYDVTVTASQYKQLYGQLCGSASALNR
jgi:glycosyltransferase involved in cell wall biosynthesis